KKTRAIRRQLTKVRGSHIRRDSLLNFTTVARKIESHTEAGEKEETLPHAQICDQGIILSLSFCAFFPRLAFLKGSSNMCMQMDMPQYAISSQSRVISDHTGIQVLIHRRIITLLEHPPLGLLTPLFHMSYAFPMPLDL